MKRLLTTLAIIAAVALTSGAPAKADLYYTLDQNGCSKTCAPTPFGVVDLTQVNSTTVSVTVTLENAAGFVSTGAGDALEFNILGDPTITVSNLTTGFAVDTSKKISASTFGSFDYGITCTVPTGCGHGGSDPNSGPLLFSTTDGMALSITDFVKNGSGYYFSSDIIAGNGNTGNVASNTAPVTINPLGSTPTPEPISLSLLSVGLLGLAAVRRRRA